MSRPYAVFDIDGTLIRWQLYHAVVSELAKQGHLSADAKQRIHDARLEWKHRQHRESFKQYEHVLVNTYLEALQQLDTDAHQQAMETVFEEYKDQVYTYTRDLIRELKAKDYLLFAVSGSHQEIISQLAGYYGFDAAVGTIYEQRDGHFTGAAQDVLGNKAEIIKQLRAKYGAADAGSIAVGDSEGDASMLAMVERPIAFNPSAGLLQIAREHGWEVVVERKNVIYRLQPHDGMYQLEGEA